MAKQTIELARQDGTEFRSVRLNIENDGSLTMDAQDMGPSVEQAWGDSDYEFRVCVKPESLSKLAFELLLEKFIGQLGAVDVFRNWCQAHGVEHEFDNWA